MRSERVKWVWRTPETFTAETRPGRSCYTFSEFSFSYKAHH